MAGFYYFLPNVRPHEVFTGDVLNFDEGGVLEATGLATVLADCRDVPGHVAVNEVPGRGPDDQSGTILYVFPNVPDVDVPVGYFPTRQEWMKADERVWIGWLKGAIPEPVDLERRRELIDGAQVRDQFDREWTVPVARSPMGTAGYLPQDYRYREDGTSYGVVKASHIELWKIAGEVWDYYNHERWLANGRQGGNRPDDLPDDASDDWQPPGAKRDFEWMRRVALMAWGVNYRVGWREANALHHAGRAVIDTLRVHAIAQALIHWEIITEVQKKTEPDPAQVS